MEWHIIKKLKSTETKLWFQNFLFGRRCPKCKSPMLMGTGDDYCGVCQRYYKDGIKLLKR